MKPLATATLLTSLLLNTACSTPPRISGPELIEQTATPNHPHPKQQRFSYNLEDLAYDPNPLKQRDLYMNIFIEPCPKLSYIINNKHQISKYVTDYFSQFNINSKIHFHHNPFTEINRPNLFGIEIYSSGIKVREKTQKLYSKRDSDSLSNTIVEIVAGSAFTDKGIALLNYDKIDPTTNRNSDPMLRATAGVIAHETAHLLGLCHTELLNPILFPSVHDNKLNLMSQSMGGTYSTKNPLNFHLNDIQVKLIRNRLAGGKMLEAFLKSNKNTQTLWKNIARDNGRTYKKFTLEELKEWIESLN